MASNIRTFEVWVVLLLFTGPSGRAVHHSLARKLLQESINPSPIDKPSDRMDTKHELTISHSTNETNDTADLDVQTSWSGGVWYWSDGIQYRDEREGDAKA